jgi:hypothetical protein
MALTVPYAPRRLYDDTSARTLAELLGRRGEIAAQRWIDVGNTLGAIAQRRREAPIRAQQQAVEALRLQDAQERIAASQAERAAAHAEAQQQVAAAERMTRQQSALQGLLNMYEDPAQIPTREIVTILGPQKGLEFAKSLRPEVPKTREIRVRKPDGTEEIQIVEDRPGFTAVSTPEPPKPVTPPNPTEASLAAAAAAGDPQATAALRLLRQNRASAGPQPDWQWVVRDGKEVYTNRIQPSDRRTASGSRVTEDERKTAGFYGQMSDAVTILDELEDSLTNAELYQIQTLPQEGLIGMANRGELSENAKRYLRAFEQFTESRLRPVSGAAIADTEYARDRRTYAKQYGETAKLKQDRQRARNRALEALRKRAGTALVDDANPSARAASGRTTQTIGRFEVEIED